VIAPKGGEAAPEPAEAVVEAEKEQRVDVATEDLRAELEQARSALAGAIGHTEMRDQQLLEAEKHAKKQAERIAGLLKEMNLRAGIISALREQLVQAGISLDVEMAKTRDAAVVALRDTPPVRNAGLGLSFAPTESGGVSVQLEGGADPVHLELKFNNGRLIRAGVTTGA
jgi:hypothetical protein